jgi:lipoate-protein ligase A
LTGWPVEHRRGGAGELHRVSAVAVEGDVTGRRVTVMDVTRGAVVLGSTQDSGSVDRSRLGAGGWEVARRRSGGGAVLVGPGRCLWVDVVVPRGDPLWDDDVGRASWWLGDAWAAALAGAGFGTGEVWRGPMQRSRWSGWVCFAGLGPGEVRVEGRKVVGISQRRTRHGAVLQSAALLSDDFQPLLDVLALSDEERVQAAAELGATTMGLGEEASDPLVRSLLAALPA